LRKLRIMAGLVDLRGMSYTEIIEKIILSLNEIEKDDFIDFIVDVDPEKIILHLEQVTSKYEIRELDDYKILRLWKTEKTLQLTSEEEFEINENTNVGRLIEKYPKAIEILASYGFTPLKNPILRKTLAKTISLGRAKMLKDLSDEEFKELMDKLKALETERNTDS